MGWIISDNIIIWKKRLEHVMQTLTGKTFFKSSIKVGDVTTAIFTVIIVLSV